MTKCPLLCHVQRTTYKPPASPPPPIMPLLPVMCTGPPAAPLPSCLFPPRHVRRTSYSLARPVSHIVSCEWAAAKQGAASSVQGLGCGVLPSTVASPSRPSAASSSSSSSATAHLISLGVRHYQPLQAEGAGAGPWDPMNPFGYVPMPHQHQGGEAPFVPLWPPAPAPAAAAVAAVEPAAAEAVVAMMERFAFPAHCVTVCI